MATSRLNRKKRHLAKLNTKIKANRPEDRVFLEREIPHKAYGSVLVVVDGDIASRIEMATHGLKISRNVPIFNTAAELPITDPYVAFYRSERYQDDEGQPVYTLQEAQSKARNAYLGDSGPISDITKNAFILALVHYTDFEGDPPDVEDDTDNETRAAYGLPPLPSSDSYSPLEKKIKHIQHMIMTDADFATDLTNAVSEAMAKVQEQGLSEEAEEISEEGFQPESAD